MSETVLETDEFEKRRIRAIYSRLRSLSDRQKENIENDPWPVLRAASAEICRLRDLIESIDNAASPPVQWIADVEPVPRYESIRDQAFSRLSEVKRLLSEFRLN